tara:strand:- start:2190 stop:2678 length:489 start_codon:yes stop_codon:yes gene_type:complete
MSDIGQIATHIYDDEFGNEPTELKREFKIQHISGWLESNVGQFNNLTYSSFSTSGDFKLEEESVLTQLYLKDFYTRQARVVLDMGATGSMDWTRLTEGDTTIVRSNRVDLARTYRMIAKDAAEALEKLVYSYNSYRAMPVQTAGFDGGFVSGSGGYYRYPPV